MVESAAAAAALASPDLANQSRERVVQNTTHTANLNGFTPTSWKLSSSFSSSLVVPRNPSGEEERRRLVKLRRDG